MVGSAVETIVESRAATSITRSSPENTSRTEASPRSRALASTATALIPVG